MRELAEARNIDEEKDIWDQAEAIRAYARQAKNKQLEIDAAEIKRRRLGFLGDTVQRADSRGRYYLPDRPVPIFPDEAPPPIDRRRGRARSRAASVSASPRTIASCAAELLRTRPAENPTPAGFFVTSRQSGICAIGRGPRPRSAPARCAPAAAAAASGPRRRSAWAHFGQGPAW